jgi:outer membrane protein OmpA-like peptidoglycan-associated protein
VFILFGGFSKAKYIFYKNNKMENTISKTNFKKGSRIPRFPFNLIFKSVIACAFILTAAIQSPLQAQETEFTKPSWWFGIAGGANVNFHRGSTYQLNSAFTPLATFHDGFGVGLYVAPLIEFHRPDTRLGFMLQAGYDSRKGVFEQVFTPCNCPADLSTDLSYITVEPSLRLAPFKSDFYLYAGPRIAFNLAKSFTYEQGISADYPNVPAEPSVTGDFSHINKIIYSMQIGAGYDIHLSSQNKQNQSVLSPFVSFQPYFGQEPRSIETWNLTTLRVGAALKFGRGSKIPAKVVIPVQVIVPEPDVKFTVNSPENIPVERRVRETFPLLNYVFFDTGSTEIPRRYVSLRKDQVPAFREDQLEEFAPLELKERSSRGMIVYYNVLNILGDRMVKNPTSSINLVGSSEKGPQDGRLMAESVKQYLVNIFEINASRISIEGRDKPKLPSEKPGGTRELDLLRQEDRRVTIESGSPALLMEFRSGPDAPLKPVEFVAVQEAPLDSYVTFNVEGAKEALSSWSLEIRDDKGVLQEFGPYTLETVSIPGKSIMGTRPQGNFNVTMAGVTKSGKTVKKSVPVKMNLWSPPANQEMMRFSSIYEFNDSKAISIYEKYLTEIVAPKIPSGGSVQIRGYTDTIGDEANNQRLSLERANDVRKILESGLAKAGRSGVKFLVYGLGEDQYLSPFDNKLPEERFYNRTVIIDILP